MKSNKKRLLLFRNDDICALSNPILERRVLELFEKYQIPQVISVIPNVVDDPHDCLSKTYYPLTENPEIIALIKEYQQKGLIEIAQHGWTHQTNTKYFCKYPKVTDEHCFQGINKKWLAYKPARRNYSEFKGLSKESAKIKIQKGKELLEDIFALKVNTFVFPWNSHDLNSLEAVKMCGFNTVCYNDSYLNVPGLNTIRLFGHDYPDVYEFFNQTQNINKKILTQFLYHSWMFKENDFNKLEEIFKLLKSKKSVNFFLAKDIHSIKNLKRYMNLSNKVNPTVQHANKYFSNKLDVYPFYVFDIYYYLEKWLKAQTVLIPLEVIGILKFTVIFFALFIVSATASILFSGKGLISMAFITLSFAFLLISGLAFKIHWNIKKSRSIAKKENKNTKKQIKEYALETLIDQVQRNPLNRELVEQYIQAYQKKQNHSLNDQLRYNQIRVINQLNPIDALNQTASIYLKQGLHFHAALTLTESLSRKIDQKGIFNKFNEIIPKIHPPFPDKLAEPKYKVSIIMPTLNRLDRLPESLSSLKNQTFQNFELILINDGGPKETEQVLNNAGLNATQYMHFENSKGVSEAANQAILQSQSQYITYLDDDDIYYPNYLEVMISALEQSQKKYVYSNTYILFGETRNNTYHTQEVLDIWDVDYKRDLLLTENMISQVALIHERSIFNKVGMFQPQLTMGQDLEFWLRCAQHTDFFHIPETLSEYRRWDQSSVLSRAVEKFYLAPLFRNYHELFQGKLLLCEGFLLYNKKKKSEKIYNDLKKRYPKHFHTKKVNTRLQKLAQKFSDHTFLKELS